MTASYEFAYEIVKNKEHTFLETLVKPSLLNCAKLVLRDSAYPKINQISMANDTIRSCIDDLAVSMKQPLISKIKKSPYFAIQ